MIRKRTYDILLTFRINYGPILHRFQNDARNWPEIAIYYFSVYLMEGVTLEFCNGATRMSKCEITLALSVQYASVTDRQTDGRTDGRTDTGRWLVPRRASSRWN